MEHLKINTNIVIYTFDECDPSKKKLIEAAKRASMNAYTPYSKFNVGAAVLLTDGSIITGNNQENAAYPSCVCAERVAILYANALHPTSAVDTVAIAANKNGIFTDDFCSPCGNCRQVISEIENRYNHHIKIIMYGEKNIYEVNSISDLLPLSFGNSLIK